MRTQTTGSHEAPLSLFSTLRLWQTITSNMSFTCQAIPCNRWHVSLSVEQLIQHQQWPCWYQQRCATWPWPIQTEQKHWDPM